MVKVCHIFDNARPGVGVTQVIYDLMTAQDFECRGIFTGRTELDPRFTRLVSQGVVKLATSPAERVRALVAMKRDGFRLLHAHGRKSAWACICARLLGFRVVRTQHFGTLANEVQKRPARLAKIRNILTLKTWWVDHWAAVSKTSKSYLQSRWDIPDDRISIIYNGIDTETFVPRPGSCQRALRSKLGWDEDWIVLISVGSLVARKRHSQLIAAFAEMPERPANARLIILGEGSERAQLENLVAAYGLSQEIRLPGRQTDVCNWLAASDILVHSALDEAFGLVIVEAMACGKPTIATGDKGPAEIVDNGKTGLLIPGEERAPLSDAMSCLISDGALRFGLGQAARNEAIRRFSLSVMGREYAALYKNITSSPQRMTVRKAAANWLQ